MYVCGYPTIPVKKYYKKFFSTLKNCHTLYEFSSSFSFWKFGWMILAADWKKDSKPYCHCKPFKSVWTPVKDTDFIFIHRPY